MGKQMAQKPINLEKYSGFHLTKSVGGGGGGPSRIQSANLK